MEFTPKNRATVQNMPKLPYAVEEALNRLRVNVSFLGSKVKKIMVISSAPDEGKSFVAMQLWRQMAEAGSKSILVDMDLRKSVMVDKYQVVREDNGKILGTSDYLASDDTLDKYVLRTNIGAGDLLPNKENIINPSMLLEGQKLASTFEELDENYRYTFIDAPPLNLVSDGEKIGSLCDGALLVVRAGETPKAMVRNSIRQLERAGCPHCTQPCQRRCKWILSQIWQLLWQELLWKRLWVLWKTGILRLWNRAKIGDSPKGFSHKSIIRERRIISQ